VRYPATRRASSAVASSFVAASEVVPKAYEVRITMCGSLALGVRLWSQDTSRGKLDWRRAYGELKMEAMEIPAEVQRRCARLLRHLGIVFGCFDFIVTPAGEWVFLEMNQMGQFLFLEDRLHWPR
jgi:hypothetical protein